MSGVPILRGFFVVVVALEHLSSYISSILHYSAVRNWLNLYVLGVDMWFQLKLAIKIPPLDHRY
jgi:hypothetical protein